MDLPAWGENAVSDAALRSFAACSLPELCAKRSTRAGAVLLGFVHAVRSGENIIFAVFRPADTGYRDGRLPLLPAPAWRAQRGCADGGTLPAAQRCSETAYPR